MGNLPAYSTIAFWRRPTGRPPKLTSTQKEALATLIEEGPVKAGFGGACWRSPMIQQLIYERFGAYYNVFYIAQLLKNLGFSYHPLCPVADNTCAHQRVVRRRRVTGSPLYRDGSRRGEGLPGAWAVLFVRATVEHPARYGPLLAYLTERLIWPSGHSAPWTSGKMIGFRAACPVARTFAYLRIADATSGTVARLATGSDWLSLGRVGFAPAGRHTKFHEGIATSNPL